MGLPVEILLRISGFDVYPHSRFGIHKEHWKTALHLIQQQKNLSVIGYSFHIDSRGVEERQKVFWESIDFLKMLMEVGMSVKVINIGGGF